MNHLESLGLRAGNDGEHRLVTSYDAVIDSGFHEKAPQVLRELGATVISTVLPELEAYHGEWQPGGFMVFPLGLHDLGSLRLHIWPNGLRRESSRGPSIHNHGWLLYSHVLAGTYTDTFFDIAPSQTDDELHAESLHVYRTIRNNEGKDVLVRDENTVTATPVLERVIPAGSIHSIDGGVYHLTTIPSHTLAATLVLNSPAFTESTDVLMLGSSPEISRERVEVGTRYKYIAKEQLLSQPTQQVA